MSREHVEAMIAAAVPMDDAGIEKLRAEINVDQHEAYEECCFIPKTEWYSLMARLDELMAYTTPVRIKTEKQAAELPLGIYHVKFVRVGPTELWEKADTDTWGQHGSRDYELDDRFMVGATVIGPFPELPHILER